MEKERDERCIECSFKEFCKNGIIYGLINCYYFLTATQGNVKEERL